jgi:hypothetical protein
VRIETIWCPFTLLLVLKMLETGAGIPELIPAVSPMWSQGCHKMKQFEAIFKLLAKPLAIGFPAT